MPPDENAKELDIMMMPIDDSIESVKAYADLGVNRTDSHGRYRQRPIRASGTPTAAATNLRLTQHMHLEPSNLINLKMPWT